jgi:hypothetical protein
VRRTAVGTLPGVRLASDSGPTVPMLRIPSTDTHLTGPTGPGPRQATGIDLISLSPLPGPGRGGAGGPGLLGADSESDRRGGADSTEACRGILTTPGGEAFSPRVARNLNLTQ